jgi:hypothetical protein
MNCDIGQMDSGVCTSLVRGVTTHRLATEEGRRTGFLIYSMGDSCKRKIKTNVQKFSKAQLKM